MKIRFMPNRAQAHVQTRRGPMSSSYRFFQVHIPKSKASEEEPSEGEKNERERKKKKRQLTADDAKSTSASSYLLYSKSKVHVGGTWYCTYLPHKNNEGEFPEPFQCTPFLHIMVVQWGSFPSTSVDSLGYLPGQILFFDNMYMQQGSKVVQPHTH